MRTRRALGRLAGKALAVAGLAVVVLFPAALTVWTAIGSNQQVDRSVRETEQFGRWQAAEDILNQEHALVEEYATAPSPAIRARLASSAARFDLLLEDLEHTTGLEPSAEREGTLGGTAAARAAHAQHLRAAGEVVAAADQGDATRTQTLLHYQPKVDAHSGQVLGVEALVRWQHPTHGLIPPGDFIPLAERTGLIGPLLDLEFPDEVAGLLARWEVPAELLVVEIAESAIMADPTHAMQVVGRLNQMGVQVSIDDFGTGYSSMAYLKSLPVHELKVDRSFVAQMTSSSRDAVIVRSTVDLGRNLGLRVVAEGVEDQATRRELDALGCDAIGLPRQPTRGPPTISSTGSSGSGSQHPTRRASDRHMGLAASSSQSNPRARQSQHHRAMSCDDRP
jgi:EAL domain-containing protein (putative c-di-GMP-specific phosphodiesterase class I)